MTHQQNADGTGYRLIQRGETHQRPFLLGILIMMTGYTFLLLVLLTQLQLWNISVIDSPAAGLGKLNTQNINSMVISAITK